MREASWRFLLTALRRAEGAPALAHERAAFETLLKQENREPEAATQSLLERLDSEPTPRTPPVPLPEPRAGSPARRWVVTAGIMASIATALGLGSLALTRPTHVAAVVTPITIAAVDHRLVPAPVLEVRDRFGRPVRSFAGSAFAALTGTSERLSGDVAVPFVRGRAVFDRVYLPTSYDTLFRLAFDVPSLPRLTIPPLEFTDRANALFLVDGSVNGIPVSPERRTVLVEPGAPVRVTVTLRYSSTYAAASLMLGATVTWGEHETAWATISPLVTPTRNQPTQARVYFTAPVEPGIYYLIFAWGAEDGVANVLSATNWTVGTPIWNDGNDIADWDSTRVAEANRDGFTFNPHRWSDRTDTIRVPATAAYVPASSWSFPRPRWSELLGVREVPTTQCHTPPSSFPTRGSRSGP